jgi:hypothetical protein
MGTTIFRQLPRNYINTYFGYRLIPGSPQQLRALGFLPTKKYSVDHLPMDVLVALGMVPNAKRLSDKNAIMMIVRNPFDRFLSICNYENIHPDALIERVKIHENHQYKQVMNAHGLKVYTIKMESKDKIVEFFKRFGIPMNLSVHNNVSVKKYTLTEKQKEFIREFYKLDFEMYNQAA